MKVFFTFDHVRMYNLESRDYMLESHKVEGKTARDFGIGRVSFESSTIVKM